MENNINININYFVNLPSNKNEDKNNNKNSINKKKYHQSKFKNNLSKEDNYKPSYEIRLPKNKIQKSNSEIYSTKKQIFLSNIENNSSNDLMNSSNDEVNKSVKDINPITTNISIIDRNSFENKSDNSNPYSINNDPSSLSKNNNTEIPIQIIKPNENKIDSEEEINEMEEYIEKQNQITSFTKTKLKIFKKTYVCTYCQRNDNDIYEIHNNNITFYYCSICYKNIITKIFGPQQYLINNENEIKMKDLIFDNTYKAKIRHIEIFDISRNDKYTLDKNVKEFIFKKNVPFKLKTYITIENNGENIWPNDCELITLNTFFKSKKKSKKKKMIKNNFQKNHTFTLYKEFINLNSFLPGKYIHTLGIQYVSNNQKKVFGNKDDLTFTINIIVN